MYYGCLCTPLFSRGIYAFKEFLRILNVPKYRFTSHEKKFYVNIKNYLFCIVNPASSEINPKKVHEHLFIETNIIFDHVEYIQHM